MQLTIIILFTAALGSFCNNVISAYINNTPMDYGRSKCFCGKKKLGILELVPVVSYMLQGGKCCECRDTIPVRYLLVEALSISLGIIYFTSFGFTLNFLINYLGFQLLLTIGIIDFYKYIIPNKLVLAFFILTIIKYVVIAEIEVLNIIGALTAVSIFILVNYAGFKLKGRYLIGAGDIKLISVLILFFGIPGSLLGLWISAAIAIPGYYLLKAYVRRFHNAVQIPFGFFLAIGYVITDMAYESIINSYINYLAA